jgi:uncharacterized protein YbbK (DUF523 family)
MSVAPAVRVGVSACLLGQQVRYDGGHKREPLLTDVLSRFVQWVPVCPEEEAGFGTPREAMRLERRRDQMHLVTLGTRRDVTVQLATAVDRRVKQLARLDLDGYILKKDSPSCGLSRVKVHGARGGMSRTGRGLFAAALTRALPMLPVEEEDRLRDPRILERFLLRVFAHSQRPVPKALMRRLFRTGGATTAVPAAVSEF